MCHKGNRNKMKKFVSPIIFLIIFVLFGFYLKNNLDFILSTFNTTIANMTRYFFVAAALVLLAFYFLSKSYQTVFKMNSLVRSWWNIIKLNFTGRVVNVVIPTAGLSQTIIYAEDARKRGESRTKAVNSVLVTAISDYTSIALFLILSLIYLYAIDSVIPHVVVPAIIFILLTISVYLLAFFAGKESKGLEKFIIFISKKLERSISIFTKRKLSLAEHADKLYKEFKDVNKAIIEDPKDWIIAILYACLQHVLLIFALYFIFISLGITPLIRVLMAGYSVGAVFVVVSPTPSGIGFVEGGMYLVFTNLGIPASIATTAVIIYRGLTFWIPLFIGFILYQRGKIKEILVKDE